MQHALARMAVGIGEGGYAPGEPHNHYRLERMRVEFAHGVVFDSA